MKVCYYSSQNPLMLSRSNIANPLTLSRSDASAIFDPYKGSAAMSEFLEDRIIFNSINPKDDNIVGNGMISMIVTDSALLTQFSSY